MDPARSEIVIRIRSGLFSTAIYHSFSPALLYDMASGGGPSVPTLRVRGRPAAPQSVHYLPIAIPSLDHPCGWRTQSISSCNLLVSDFGVWLALSFQLVEVGRIVMKHLSLLITAERRDQLAER